MIFENESEEIGRVAEENKVDPLETLVINKKEFEQLFLDFFIQYDMIYDFSSSLDLFELEAEIIENSREKNGKIILKIESIKEALKKSSFFRRFFLKDFTNVLWRFASMTTCSHFV